MKILLSRKKVAASLAILIVCLAGDKNSKPTKEVDLAAAVCDNATHAIIGIMTWFGIEAMKTAYSVPYVYFEMLLCGLCSSVIDFDHFISVKSWNLKDAVNLKHRPFMHCTTGTLFVCSVVLGVSFRFKINWLYRFGWILVAAFLSHHIRDSSRRGFWLWPFGHTKSTPYALYLMAQALLPHCLSACMSLVSFENTQIYDQSDVSAV